MENFNKFLLVIDKKEEFINFQRISNMEVKMNGGKASLFSGYIKN